MAWGAAGVVADANHLPVEGDGTLIQEAYERLKRTVEEAAEDIKKAEGGNKAAGTRVRKTMQDVKKAAQDLRVAVLEARDDSDSS